MIFPCVPHPKFLAKPDLNRGCTRGRKGGEGWGRSDDPFLEKHAFKNGCGLQNLSVPNNEVCSMGY